MREARESNVIEKPITMGGAEARESNVIEKPITLCYRGIIPFK
ncbi:hypothetical protein MKY96_19315 [Paenibacillus sp. FSL R7-0302]